MPGEATTFGEWLKARRKAQDLTQDDLAERAGCSVWTIRKIETGERKPSRQLVDLLAAALRVPDPERALFARFARAQTPAALPAPGSGAPDGPMPPPATAHNLPVLPTSLIGREVEMAAGYTRLGRDRVRLLTLTGAPGIGKTRLAVELSWRLLPAFPDGVTFVPLAAISDPTLLAVALAGGLGLPDRHEPPGPALAAHLRDRQALLVLDNFEQIVSAGHLLAELLRTCPRLQMLVTSREALHLRVERLLPIPPLSLPGADDHASAETAMRSAAVQLFVERAQAASAFRLVAGNAHAVATICARLDAIPLAIELVAARSRLLSPQAMLARLDASAARRPPSLQLAAGGERDLPVRHQTLRNAIAWSYDLLAAGEQQLFARLGVFVGGSTLAAAEAICDAEGDLAVDVLEGLESLLDKSLLMPQRPADEMRAGGGEPRFEMLATIREYAAERLEESGAAAHTRQWHAEYYLALADTADAELGGARQTEWLTRLEQEHANLRAALHWALGDASGGAFAAGGDAEVRAEMALRLCGALGRFWEMHSHLTEGRTWLDRALAQAPGGRSATRATALSAAGTLAKYQGDFAVARQRFAESLALRQELGDQSGIGASLNSLGTLAWTQGDYAEAQRLFGASLTVRQEIGDKPAVAASLSNLAAVSQHLGDPGAARRFQEESLLLMRELGNKRGIATSLTNLGGAAWGRGDYATARALFEESLGLARELGHRSGIADSLCNLGEVLTAQGDFETARRLHEESLRIRQELEDRWGTAFSLEGLARLAYRQGAAARAVQLYGAAAALRQAIRSPLAPGDQTKQDVITTALRSQLGEVAYHDAWQRGHTLPLEAIVAVALETGLPASPTGAGRP